MEAPSLAAATPAPSDAVPVTAHAHILTVEENKKVAPAVPTAATHDDMVVPEANTKCDSEKCAHKKWPFKVQPVESGKGGLGQIYCSIMPVSQTQI